ncbi:MAG: hypothetical protein WDM89_13595 [Rhizomicrobium sp.]
MTSRNFLLGGAVAAILVLPTAVLADAHSEIVNADEHAGYAAAAADMAGAQAHLHHALNCLVGPGGSGFDAKQMNPCAQSGKGAIPDTSDAKKKAALESAASKARDGLATADIAAAKKAAADAEAILKKEE